VLFSAQDAGSDPNGDPAFGEYSIAW
jgi:hypothetical protein